MEIFFAQQAWPNLNLWLRSKTVLKKIFQEQKFILFTRQKFRFIFKYMTIVKFQMCTDLYKIIAKTTWLLLPSYNDLKSAMQWILPMGAIKH